MIISLNVRDSKETKNTKVVKEGETRLCWFLNIKIAADPASLFKFQSNAASYEPNIDPSQNEKQYIL